jgi:23S rRNA (cytidine1920-2'-O)/16S rRNA (cytidine1409-2'-O)-methyltransferase
VRNGKTEIRKTKTEKRRLDVLLVERGLAESRQRAQALILAGRARISGTARTKAGTLVAVDAPLELSGGESAYASRAGEKLAGALKDFGVSPRGWVCLDVGASTGGFTDCLLQRGALRVYAVDVTTSQLAWKLRQDSRVMPIEKNARFLLPADIPEPAQLITADLSFIGLSKVLPALVPLAAPGAHFVLLVKPQFELERSAVGRGGLVRDPALHRRAIDRVRAAAASSSLSVLADCPSRLPGAEGNAEFFLHAQRPGSVAGVTILSP